MGLIFVALSEYLNFIGTYPLKTSLTVHTVFGKRTGYNKYAERNIPSLLLTKISFYSNSQCFEGQGVKFYLT